MTKSFHSWSREEDGRDSGKARNKLKDFTNMEKLECRKMISTLIERRSKEVDEIYAEKGLLYLHKKLLDTHGSNQFFINFYNTIMSQGRDIGQCVLIPMSTSKDRRITIGGKRTFPHIHYIKILRWPDFNLRKNALMHIQGNTDYLDNENSEELCCVNPYHYELVYINKNVEEAASQAKVEHGRYPEPYQKYHGYMVSQESGCSTDVSENNGYGSIFQAAPVHLTPQYNSTLLQSECNNVTQIKNNRGFDGAMKIPAMHQVENLNSGFPESEYDTENRNSDIIFRSASLNQEPHSNSTYVPSGNNKMHNSCFDGAIKISALHQMQNFNSRFPKDGYSTGVIYPGSVFQSPPLHQVPHDNYPSLQTEYCLENPKNYGSEGAIRQPAMHQVPNHSSKYFQWEYSTNFPKNNSFEGVFESYLDHQGQNSKLESKISKNNESRSISESFLSRQLQDYNKMLLNKNYETRITKSQVYSDFLARSGKKKRRKQPYTTRRMHKKKIQSIPDNHSYSSKLKQDPVGNCESYIIAAPLQDVSPMTTTEAHYLAGSNCHFSDSSETTLSSPEFEEAANDIPLNNGNENKSSFRSDEVIESGSTEDLLVDIGTLKFDNVFEHITDSTWEELHRFAENFNSPNMNTQYPNIKP